MSDFSGLLDLDEIFNESAGEIGEKPAHRPADENSISVPASKEIDVKAYNDAITRLQKSFKESIDFMESLKSMRVVEHCIEDEQDTYTEQMIFESYCDGPYYEKVNAANKEEIKRIAKEIRTKFLSSAHDMKVLKSEIDKIVGSVNDKNTMINSAFSIPNSIPYTLLKWGIDMWIVNPILISKFNNSRLKLYAWQTICYVYGKGMKLADVKKKLNDMYQDELGDKYEIEIVKMKFFLPTIRGKKELTEDEKDRDSYRFTNYLLIVNEKGTSISNKEEEIKVESDAAVKMVSALKATEDIEPSSESSIKSGFKKLIEKIKSKVSKKKKDEDKSEDE